MVNLSTYFTSSLYFKSIYGLDAKEIRYQYNSQDQITQTNYGYNSEFKRYSYYYDYAGRLYTLNYANTDPTLDKSAIDYNFTTYSYNPNSLVSFQFFNSSQLQNQYEYSNRNWITSMNSLQGLFGFTNTYFLNGNVNTQLLFGTYKDFYPENNYNLNYRFTYDNSNRLLEAVNTNQGDLSFSVLNTYDKDGNITTLKRYGDNNIVTDDFNYQYYSGTNKLSKVSGAIDQYSYDLNGNVTRDTVNYNFNIQYDHRNLITQFYHTDRAASSRPYTYATRYYYDESGNRVRKLEYFNTQTNPPLISDWDNPGNGWTLLNNEFYVKGADGKDLATYQGNILDEWFVWGTDLVGKIKNDKAYYYYKDHLGSVRVVVDDESNIVAGYDYDAWGYPLENRTYNADSIKFKYTGKELDKESLYDYFGARYYDSRIGSWGSVDPLLGKYPSYSPYSFSYNNPLIFIDPNGKDPKRKYLGSVNDVVNIIENLPIKTYGTISLALQNVKGNYVYTKKGGFIDMVHFFMAANVSASTHSTDLGIIAGSLWELKQDLFGQYSAYNKEDPMSNKLGSEFGKMASENYLGIYLLQFMTFMEGLEPLEPNDPSISEDMIYIPYDENDTPLGPIEGNIDWFNPSPYHGDMIFRSPKYYHEFQDPRIYFNPNF